MRCDNPYVNSNQQAYGCGQCLPCKINKRREWTHRLMLEATQWETNVFVTLTYDDEHLPEGGTLVPKHAQDWLRRLRKTTPDKIRFFLVGEYGDKSERPHYHAIIFNYPCCLRGRTDHVTRMVSGSCCKVCDTVGRTWTFGSVDLGEVNKESAGYLCGYTVKKMTAPDDVRLNGRHPEFSRQSNGGGRNGEKLGGIGAGAMIDVAADILGSEKITGPHDVPFNIRHGGENMPMGRYLRGILKQRLGYEKTQSQVEANLQAAKMLPLRMRSRDSTAGFKATLLESTHHVRERIHKREKLFNQGKEKV